jgi:hypothetical protein
MRVLRGLLGVLLWLVAGVLGLVSILLCVTVLLLPVGIPLLRLSRKLFGQAARLMLPPALAHPVKETKKWGRSTGDDVAGVLGKGAKRAGKARGAAGKAGEEAGKQAGRTGKKAKQAARKRRKRWWG